MVEAEPELEPEPEEEREGGDSGVRERRGGGVAGEWRGHLRSRLASLIKSHVIFESQFKI